SAVIVMNARRRPSWRSIRLMAVAASSTAETRRARRLSAAARITRLLQRDGVRDRVPGRQADLSTGAEASLRAGTAEGRHDRDPRRIGAGRKPARWLSNLSSELR